MIFVFVLFFLPFCVCGWNGVLRVDCLFLTHFNSSIYLFHATNIVVLVPFKIFSGPPFKIITSVWTCIYQQIKIKAKVLYTSLIWQITILCHYSIRDRIYCFLTGISCHITSYVQFYVELFLGITNTMASCVTTLLYVVAMCIRTVLAVNDRKRSKFSSAFSSAPHTLSCRHCTLYIHVYTSMNKCYINSE